MLITYCRNELGEERLYLTPHGSLEAWLAPAGGGGWTLEIAPGAHEATAGFDAAKAEPTRRFLLQALAVALDLAEEQLQKVPFEELTRLATPMPAPARRRIGLRRQRGQETGWVIAEPVRLEART